MALHDHARTSLTDYGAAPKQFQYTGQIQEPKAHGLTARRQLNCTGILAAIVIPAAFFFTSFHLMSYELFFHKPEVSLLFVALELLIVLTIGANATQAHRRKLSNGESSWWSFIFLAGLFAIVLGASLGYTNYTLNTRQYYDYIGLRKATNVEPARSQGQQMLDVGEIVFKADVSVNRALHMGFHRTRTYCVAPIVPSGNASLATYDFWAVGMDCCYPAPNAFSCGRVSRNHADEKELAGLRVLDDKESAGYALAVEQAVSAYNIQAVRPIFLYMMARPYSQIRGYMQHGQTFELWVGAAYVILQAALVFYSAYTYGKGVRSGHMDISRSEQTMP